MKFGSKEYLDVVKYAAHFRIDQRDMTKGLHIVDALLAAHARCVDILCNNDQCNEQNQSLREQLAIKDKAIERLVEALKEISVMTLPKEREQRLARLFRDWKDVARYALSSEELKAAREGK